MKKILIIGDSYGAGEWLNHKPNNDYYRKLINEVSLNDLVESHPGLEYYLNEMGHACVCNAIGGASNITTLNDTEHTLMLRSPRHKFRFINPDYIIWFLTEPIRDLRSLDDINNRFVYYNEINDIRKTSKSIEDLNKKLLKNNFEIANKIYKLTNIPFIIVEGLSKTYDLEKEYNFCHFKVNNWVGNMININVPIITSWQTIDLIKKHTLYLYKTEEMQTNVNKYDEWLRLITESETFPDNAHANKEEHEKLSLIINDFITKY